MKKALGFFAFLGSVGTLFCCVIPAMLAVLAGGAAVTAFIGAFPWIVPLSQNKEWLFLVAGLLLGINGFFVFRPESKLVCSVTKGGICRPAGIFSRSLFVLSLIFYGAALFTAYGLVPLMKIWES